MLRRFGQDDAAALGALDDLRIVEGGIETEQTESEAAAAVLRAVAGPLVAAGPRQDRRHLAAEADWRLVVGATHAHRHSDFPTRRLDGQRRVTVLETAHQAARIHAGHFRVAAGEAGRARQLTAVTARVDAEHAEMLFGARPTQLDGGGEDGQRERAGLRFGGGEASGQQERNNGQGGARRRHR